MFFGLRFPINLGISVDTITDGQNNLFPVAKNIREYSLMTFTDDEGNLNTEVRRGELILRSCTNLQTTGLGVKIQICCGCHT